MTKATPIKDRIRAAMGDRRAMQYHDLMQAVFPEADYPRAWRYQSNGGPPGCAMAFGRAIREMGWIDSGRGSVRTITKP